MKKKKKKTLRFTIDLGPKLSPRFVKSKNKTLFEKHATYARQLMNEALDARGD